MGAMPGSGHRRVAEPRTRSQVTEPRYHRSMPIAAYLRVYVPVSGSDGPVLEHVADRSGRASVLRQGEFGLSAESARDDAFVIDEGGRRFVCPRHPRLRMLEGLLAFRGAFGDSSIAALVPESVADRAAEELDRIHDRFPGAKSHILTSPFAIPLRWFAVFEQSDRLVTEEHGRMAVRYLTELTTGLQRARRAVQVLEDVGFDEAIIEQVGDVVRWLEDFPRDALVELDYGGVADLFDETDLVLDESAADIGASLDALARGDFDAAGEHYAVAASRWAPAHALAYAN